jgi:type VI secretion system protein ImpC
MFRRRSSYGDLQRAPGFDQSALFKKVYDEALGTLGGMPFGALVGNYEFGKSAQDVELLEKVSRVAAAAHAPFLAAAAPEMFDLENYTQLDVPSRLKEIFRVEHSKWKHFQQSEDARYVALTVPRMLMREPYGNDTVPVKAFRYEEHVDGTDHKKHLWGNASWALAACVMSAFVQYGWYAAIRGVEGGGLVEGLPVHTFRTDEGDIAMKGPTETPITYYREKELADLGFTPLVQRKGTPNAVFNWVRTAHKASRERRSRTGVSYKSSIETWTSSDDLRAVLCVSRFAQYIAVLWHSAHRWREGDVTDAERGSPSASTENALQRWLSGYVQPRNDRGSGPNARRPLRCARVEIRPADTQDGRGVAILEAWPAYLLEDLEGPLSVAVMLRIAVTRQARALGTTAATVRTTQPVELHMLYPSEDPRSVLDAFSRALGYQSWLLSRVALGPLTARGSIAADGSLDNLIDFAADEASQLELDVTELLSKMPLDLSRLAFLAKYPSGAVRGLSGEIVPVADRYVLRLVDPLSLLDPQLLIEHQPSEPLRCEFDMLILEVPTNGN